MTTSAWPCKRSIASLVLTLAAAVPASAHDFWLISDFLARAGQKIRIKAHTGDR